MFHLAIEFVSENKPVRAYAANVGRAARGLLAALLAVQTRPAPVVVSVSHDRHADDSAFAHGRSDTVMPNLGAELRFMASRG